MVDAESDSTDDESRRTRIALIGCGAISELYHLPALQANGSLDNLVLVDSDAARAEQLAQAFGVRETATDYREVVGDVEGAIVATPPSSHYEICLAFLHEGTAVLCEKPLAEDPDEARALVAAAESSEAPLAVNQTRRAQQMNAKVREMILEGRLGDLQSIDYIDGSIFAWPTASGFYFRPGARGVLADRGVHSLDLICWWLGAKPQLVSSQNDSYGGPESLAILALAHGDCRIGLKLSWLTKLQNTFRVKGRLGQVDGDITNWRSLRLTDSGGRVTTIKLEAPEITYNDFGKTIVGNFLSVIEGRAAPTVPASTVVSAIELIAEAYERVERMSLPWLYGAEVDDG